MRFLQCLKMAVRQPKLSQDIIVFTKVLFADYMQIISIYTKDSMRIYFSKSLIKNSKYISEEQRLK